MTKSPNIFSVFWKKINQSFVLKAGFTLTFAILIGTLLTGIGISITGLVSRELGLSSISRESQVAFYAADSGVECAMFWDVHGRYIDPIDISREYDSDDPDPKNRFYFAQESYPDGVGDAISCAGVTNVLEDPTAGSESGRDYYRTKFQINFSLPANSCAIVYVTKYVEGTGLYNNKIEAHGINDCSGTDNPYRVERALKVEYN